ncbi:unnamed protein product, partial [Owenia fusiformis]
TVLSSAESVPCSKVLLYMLSIILSITNIQTLLRDTELTISICFSCDFKSYLTICDFHNLFINLFLDVLVKSHFISSPANRSRDCVISSKDKYDCICQNHFI